MWKIWMASLAFVGGCTQPAAPPTDGGQWPPDGGYSAADGGGAQRLLLSTHQLRLTEGEIGSFTLALDEKPNLALAVSIDSSKSLQISPATWLFTSENYAQPIEISVTTMVDADTADETGTVGIHAYGVSDEVAVAVKDLTQVIDVGEPKPFSDTLILPARQVACAKVAVGTSGTLASFGLYAPGGAGKFRMAVYSDDGTGKPGPQLVGMPHAIALVDGVNQGRAPPNVTVDAGALFVCTVFAQTTSIGAAPAASNRNAVRCDDDYPQNPVTDAWPADLSADSFVCANSPALNLWIRTYHQ